jgi:peptidyl-prolyl cis-trans isomerase C
MKRILISVCIAYLFVLTACSKTTPETPTQTSAPETAPTPTSLPMALIVNGEGILLSDYQAELVRLQQAQAATGNTSTPEEQKNRVISNFTDLILLSQAAIQGGYTVDDAMIQSRIDKLVADLGSADKLTAWQAANGYTDESFRTELRREILAGWQRDKIIESVPTTAEQVHVRQILLQDEENANAVYTQLKAGADFATLAKDYDPVLGGDLGWFPSGMLTQPNVDEAAFALQPGEMSQVIKSAIGFHILYVIERDPAHPLSIDARKMLQQKALTDWLASSRAVSTVEVLVP